ncbi:DUF4148 domain-containing protein [Paraburkholderia heleia]|uniref:DUF4148 domain-containing protein n=1 Tax=Paraburkholderia heleia TaxID=634127 RepID=UPI0031E40A8B
MNLRVAISLPVLALTFGGFACAASAQGLTRAEVRADLIRVEQAGYNPSIGNDATYPADIQAAEAKIAAQDHQSLANDAMGGTSMSGMSDSGLPMPSHNGTSSSCVGPSSYCNIFFGS